MLEAKNITAAYESREVLRDIFFSLENAEIMAVLGPNGAGKTSLIKVLNGALPLTFGHVLVDTLPLTTFSRREIAQRIAVVAQENETKFPVSVIEYVLAGRFAHGGVFGWESEQDVQVANEVLAQCDISGFRNRMMNELSGGERQRVVFARALATGARVLLLDEPTANLDLAHQALMFRLVKKRCRELGYSAVVVTHDLNLASQFADKVLLLRNGGVHELGSPENVLTEKNIREVFAVDVFLDRNPANGNVRITNIY
jgi:iron complex transport system ATP-binding protein